MDILSVGATGETPVPRSWPLTLEPRSSQWGCAFVEGFVLRYPGAHRDLGEKHKEQRQDLPHEIGRWSGAKAGSRLIGLFGLLLPRV